MTIDFRRLSTTVDPATSSHAGVDASTERPNIDRLWFLAGLLFVLAALVWLEHRQPYYFSQDDNLAGALPVHLLGCRTFFDGHFPTYNPYQFLGSPLNTTGCSMVLYPFLNVAYAIARWGLHNPNTTDDVFCIMHLVAGYWACRLLARSIGLQSMTSTLASTSFVLSGFSLIGSRSWDDATPLIVYLPLTFLLLIRLVRTRPDWKWLARAAVVFALFMNSGFVQLWLYAMLFVAAFLGIAVLTRRSTIRRLAWTAPAFLIGLAAGTPLLLSFRQATEGWTRGGTAEGPRMVWSNLLNIMLPSTLAPPISNGPEAFRWGSLYYQNMGELYNSGILLTTIGLLSTIAALIFIVARPGRRERIWLNVWGLLAVMAFVCALGSQSFLWPIMHALPLMRQMESPFKFAPFVNLFLILQGALVLDAWLRKSTPGAMPIALDRHVSNFVNDAVRPTSSRSSSVQEGIIAAVALALLGWHVSLCKPAFYTYGDRPYPALPTAEATLLKSQPGRILTIAPPRSIVPGFVDSLANQWATEYRIPALLGYDPPVSELPSTARVRAFLDADPDAALRAYGVRWIVVHRTALHPTFGPNPLDRDLETVDPAYLPIYKAECYRHRPALITPNVLIFAVDNPASLAFDAAHPLPITMDATGLGIELAPSTQSVVVNFALRPGMTATVDGRPAPLGVDRWGRIVTTGIPAGSYHLRIRYTFPWALSLKFGILLFGAGLLLAVGMRRLTRRA